jgi:hypothetical protein
MQKRKLVEAMSEPTLNVSDAGIGPYFWAPLIIRKTYRRDR